ncbi:hypothetical protein DFP72DRAFT_1165320 [Ephemerocybe angulata]|uniref:Uncharacterized protein n=1 Tax=Ephemerocybe angulata TaxID=980116 RepID=A0A8H6MA55_9AGAR|nr:hypothetical protein DFP72DRAFT_1165320 [Tulosesus angulatus]
MALQDAGALRPPAFNSPVVNHGVALLPVGFKFEVSSLARVRLSIYLIAMSINGVWLRMVRLSSRKARLEACGAAFQLGRRVKVVVGMRRERVLGATGPDEVSLLLGISSQSPHLYPRGETNVLTGS